MGSRDEGRPGQQLDTFVSLSGKECLPLIFDTHLRRRQSQLPGHRLAQQGQDPASRSNIGTISLLNKHKQQENLFRRSLLRAHPY